MAPRRAKASRSAPDARRPAGSLPGMPSSRSMVSTRRAESSRCTRGKWTVSSWAKLWANSSMLRRSWLKSSSCNNERRSWRTRATGRTALRSWECFSARSAMPARIERSARIRLSMPCFWILTTTGSPERRRARWTCAIEAEAKAVGSNSANASSGGRPSSLAKVARAVAGGSAGVLACRRASSVASACPTNSGRVLNIWPSLMKVVPRSVRARRKRSSTLSPAIDWPSSSRSQSCSFE